MRRTLLSIFLILTLSLTVLTAPAAAAGGSLPEGLVLTQSRGGTCTLASAAMMLRSRLYLSGSDRWQEATESDVGRTAWCSQGLYWSFSYTLDGYTLAVEHESLSGLSLPELESLLLRHPEGIVLYCGNVPHAVFVTGIENGTVFCADPAYGTWGPLADSWLGVCGGQDAILRSVTACWYVSE